MSKRASPGISCKNLKYSTTLEYLNSEVIIMKASNLLQIQVHNKDGSKDSNECGDKRFLIHEQFHQVPDFECCHENCTENIQYSDHKQPTLQLHLLFIIINSSIHQHHITLNFHMIIVLQLFMQSKNYQFFLEDQNWLNHLKENGFVVIKEVVKEEEVIHAKNLFWEWLEALGSGIKRNDPETWVDKNWPGSGSIGFFVSYGGCHSKASWYLRTHPRVRQAFSKIWGTRSLITSFDTFICWRPWWNVHSKSTWNPFVENLHVDQNPHYKRGFHCVQGMIPLIDVSINGVGGLQVVPKTNNDAAQDELIQRYPWVVNGKSDWVELKFNDPFKKDAMLILCQAGDLILFDSRTVHGGKIQQPIAMYKQKNANDLVRLAMTVTMVPKELETVQTRQKRLEAFKNRIGLTHWPQQYHKAGFGTQAVNIKHEKIQYDWPKLTPQIEDLI